MSLPNPRASHAASADAGGQGGQQWVLSSGVPSPAVPLLCPSDAGQLPGILQAGEEGRKVH